MSDHDSSAWSHGCHEGFNANQAGRELGLSHGTTYRLRNKARGLGLIKTRRDDT